MYVVGHVIVLLAVIVNINYCLQSRDSPVLKSRDNLPTNRQNFSSHVTVVLTLDG